jgi:glycosyltransferase involved in cell wall biosynthesis
MHITYITSSRIPTERAYGFAITKLCSEWAAAGHQVELIAPRKRFSITEDPYSYYGLPKAFSFKMLRASDFLGKRVTASHIPFVLDFLSFLYSLRAASLSKRVLYTREYLLANFLPAQNLFLEVHTIPSRGYLFRRALARAHGIVTISGGIRDELVGLGIPTERILVAHDGVDLATFSQVVADKNVWREFGIDPTKKIVLYTGHFYGWKGANTLAESAKFLPSDVRVVLMGGIDKELEEFRAKYKSERVHIIKQQPRERIPTFLKSADVLVIPNSAKKVISRVYASPLKLFEYMAAGVPIVASDVPSLREILDEKSGFFFAPDDASSLALVVGDVLADAKRAAERAAHAMWAVRAYTWTARAAGIANFIATTNTGHTR